MYLKLLMVFIRQFVIIFTSVFLASTVSAQEYPTKTIKIIVPFAPGGGSDVITRLISERMSADLNVPVVIENKPGGSTIIGTDAVAKAAPNGYTLLLTNRAITVNPWLFKLPFDTSKLTPVSQIASSSLLLVANPGVPHKNLKGLIEYAKANPGKVTIGNSGAGQLPHLAGVLFAASSGTNITMVNYKGSGSSVTDLIGGQINLSFGTVPSFIQHIKNGKLIPIAISSSSRSPTLPNVPVIAEVLPGYDLVSWFGIFAPPDTPKNIVDRLRQSIQASLNQPEFKLRLTEEGLDPSNLSPATFEKVFQADIVYWGKFIKENNIRLD